METKANYLLVGIFTLAVIAAGFGFFLWMAKLQIDRSYAQYDVIFDEVSGLAQSSTVTFNGVNVGKVIAIALDRADPSKVRVRIEVAASTPVRQGTQATLASQGVTGVSYVGLEGGGGEAPYLEADPATGVPVIPTKTTVVQGLLADAPDLLAKAISVLDDMGRFSTQENADHVAAILANLDQASGRLNEMMDELTRASGRFSEAADKISAFATKLDGVAGSADATLAQAQDTLADLDRFASQDLPRITTQVSGLSQEASRMVGALSSLIARIQRDPARFFLGNRTPEYSR